MSTEDVLKRLEEEIAKGKADQYDAHGLIRLQEEARNYEGEYRLVWSDELLKELDERPKTQAHQTGLPLLDEIIGGFRAQQLVTISAHSKHGKTAFALFLMEQMEKLSPLMIPLEQSNEELIEQRKENGYSVPRFLSPRKLAARVTVDWIEERIVEAIAKYNTKLVVIDHLGYVDDFGEGGRYSRENHAHRIEMVMQGLKGLAKRWNVSILLLVHISQQDEGRPPSLQDLKGSSSILQESDLVIMLWRKNNLKKKVRVYQDKIMVSVLANRRSGRNGNVGLEFNRSTGRYEEKHKWVEDMEKAALASVEADDIMDSV